jgi:transcriptional regulator with XRE-family HTH domain
MNRDRLKTLFEQAKDKHAEAKEIGTTYQTMYNIIYKGRPFKVDLLEKIAAHYHVPVGYFFDEAIPNSEDQKAEIEKLRAQVDILKEVIKSIKTP